MEIHFFLLFFFNNSFSNTNIRGAAAAVNALHVSPSCYSCFCFACKKKKRKSDLLIVSFQRIVNVS